MDYTTAHQLLLYQGNPPGTDADALLTRLKQGKPPIPGQVTTLLLALKIVFEALRDVDSFNRELVYALHSLASDSRELFVVGQRQGVTWPPLLDEDLTRIAIAVKSIFAGVWQG
ncbi:Dethiobiotin synthetase [Oscillatoria sp. FACHB-1407]|uniref:Dethiobiotin synthetase n=1 Tax=Oscillatoria sp. FACHB-1407 TaxID=2692847 RepID=UPI0016853B91|nr:Dethiobiotin synthetase [Oscillatoria sp. FACHB-1407]MBD2462389.1 Dethiobiotin synthetase [Oscillatoria sp. FACHB-1407]